jgi:hypothetical protein
MSKTSTAALEAENKRLKAENAELAHQLEIGQTVTALQLDKIRRQSLEIMALKNKLERLHEVAS